MRPFADHLIESAEGDLPPAMDSDSWMDLAKETIDGIEGRGLVMSDESLSWLYHEDEMRRLVDLFEGWEVSVVCYLRHPHALRASYRWMTSFMMARLPNRRSVYYSEPDSWIYDYEYRMDRWRRLIGRRNVLTMSYSACLERDGSVVPSFLELLGVPLPPPEEIAKYHLNPRD